MTRPITDEVRASARSLEDVYTRMHVLEGTDHSPLAPPDLIRPDGIPASAFPYLVGTENRDFNLGVLYDNNQTGLNALLAALSYNATRAQEIDAHVRELGDDEAGITTYLDGLSVGDRRNYSVFSTLQVLDFFRNRGNTDGVQNTVSMQEIASWAWERCGHNTATHQATAAPAIRRLHAMLGLAIFIQSEPPVPPRTVDTRLLETHAPADSIAFAAPQGGWQTGDRIFINGTAWTSPVPLTGTAQVTIPGSALRAGSNTIEVRNGTNTWVTLPVTISTPAPAPVAVAPETATGERSWFSRHSTELWIGGTGAAALLVTGIAAALRIRGLRAEARAEGSRASKAESDLRAARADLEARVRELGDAAGVRARAVQALEPVRMDIPTAEARVRDAEAELQAARDRLSDAESGIHFRGNRAQQARARERFEEASREVDRVETELAAERAARDNLPDGDPMKAQHADRVNILEGELRAANERLGEVARNQGDALQARQEARAEVRRLEAALREAQASLERARGIGNAFDLLGARPNPQPQPQPPPPAPNPGTP